jgi:bifunctional non-homologous end joining protein LigD
MTNIMTPARKTSPRKSPAKRAPVKRAARPKAGAEKKAAPAKSAVQKSLAPYRAKRNFEVTAEPSGARQARTKNALAFVIQKHAASHLHFDLRLEVDGVMKSWAVPKGPNVDPTVKRLAMQVEDHPVAYNTFEGTIPQGEYGGGTVMLWDRGTYTPDEIDEGESENDAARRALAGGKLSFTFHGTRLKGSFALVRTRRGESKPQWLLIKHKDQYAKAGYDIVAKVTTSVESGRNMEEIGAGRKSRKVR